MKTFKKAFYKTRKKYRFYVAVFIFYSYTLNFINQNLLIN